MTRSLLTTPAGNRLLRNARSVQSKLARFLSAFRAIKLGARFGRRSGKLRGPILWLGDLHKRKDRS
ncbi:hypothetical protein [Bradyrhizobium sp. SSUT77]|uniref:hypothetical protein n=1 Tax=Bradyrhizobium sp. SSUT77 TaxID=3040603 RepID=UPI00244723D5|nr:hypothetical protein [Bradyrhizobium sp. SSUT77]MDH2348632.1 hypothetical protein [Bradyrhizobium sp. SSUT77]